MSKCKYIYTKCYPQKQNFTANDWIKINLAIDSSDNIYVVDKQNNNIQKFSLYGKIDKNVLPEWVRNTAIWWSEGILDKKDLLKQLVDT
jgi:hypothetical protein